MYERVKEDIKLYGKQQLYMRYCERRILSVEKDLDKKLSEKSICVYWDEFIMWNTMFAVRPGICIRKLFDIKGKSIVRH